MPYVQSETLSRDGLTALACDVSPFGDLICPHCRCQVITPAYAQVIPGWGRSPRCHRRFSVDEHQALVANQRAAALSAGKAG